MRKSYLSINHLLVAGIICFHVPAFAVRPPNSVPATGGSAAATVTIGGAVTSGTANQVLFIDGSGNLAGNSKLVYSTTTGMTVDSNAPGGANLLVKDSSQNANLAVRDLLASNIAYHYLVSTGNVIVSELNTAGGSWVNYGTGGFGVGTASPAGKLDVSGITGSYALRVSTDNASAPVALGVTNAGVVTIANNIASPLTLDSQSGSPALNFTYPAGNNDGVINFQQAGGDTAGITVGATAGTMALRYGGTSTVNINASSMSVTGNMIVSGYWGGGSNAAPRTNVTPSQAGLFIYNSTGKEMCFSTGTLPTTWCKDSAPTTACSN